MQASLFYLRITNHPWRRDQRPEYFWIAGLCLMAIALIVSACGTQHATQPAARSGVERTISPTPDELVSVRVVARQSSGSVAQRNVVLTAHITVTNRTDHPVSLYGTCQQEAIVASLVPQNTQGAPIELVGSPNCPIVTGGDVQPAVAPYNAHTYTRMYELFGFAPNWQAGAYIFTVVVPAWHQAIASGLGGSATGRTTITLT